VRVLVACEYSGRVSAAFRERGHTAWSCDLEPTDGDEDWHWQGDAIRFARGHQWDLLIAHPPCTFLTNAGARWFYHPDDTALPKSVRRVHPDYPDRWRHRDEAVEFFRELQALPIQRKCIENSLMSRYGTERVGKMTQRVQPWMFGEPFTKGACLWLEDLPLLVPTHTMDHWEQTNTALTAACHMESPGPDRWKRRSTTYQSIATAMAEQWG